jgi:uncharacterized protein (TIGR03435 family)
MKPLTILACLASFSFGFAAPPASKPAFEVASIKRSDPDPSNRITLVGMKANADTVHYTNITLKDCIRAAYGVRNFQVQGPDWLDSVRFNIDAKLPAGTSMEQIPEMMQSLLADRFGMILQHGTKEQSVYVLVAGKDGPKLKPSTATPDNKAPTALGPDGKPRPLMMIGFPSSGLVVHAPAATIAAVAETISRFTARPVVDMTGVEGRYQFDLTFEPETMGGIADPRVGPDGTRMPAGDPAPSLSSALQAYGLQIEPRKAPLEMLTVTHVEKTPTEN